MTYPIKNGILFYVAKIWSGGVDLLGAEHRCLDLYQNIDVRNEHDEIYLSSDIFETLAECESFKSKRVDHISFAFSYLYVITWMYRYCRFEPIMNNTNYTINEAVKIMIGLSKDDRRKEYIIKNDGVLDALGLTETISFFDMPVWWILQDDNKVEFTTYKEQYLGNMPNSMYNSVKGKKTKKPVKSTCNRTIGTEIYDGSYSDKRMTVLVDFKVFLYCTGNDEIGHIGFYLYSFLLLQSLIYGGDFTMSMKMISEKTMIKEQTLKKYIPILEKYKMVNICKYKGAEVKHSINSYTSINKFGSFLK